MKKLTTIYDIKQESADYIKHYITVSVDEPICDVLKSESVFFDLFEHLNKNNINILQERIYGITSEHKKILSIRDIIVKKKYSKSTMLPTFVEGVPCIGGFLAGIHIIGVSSYGDKALVKTIEHNNNPVGRIFENDKFKEIFLYGVSDYKNAVTRAEQVRLMFYKAKDILEKQNCGMDKIIRTWIYFPRILDWYEEFNIERNKCFKEFNLTPYMPASTGIQGKRFDGEECFMDVFCFVPKNKEQKVSVMKHNRQNEAFEYGSSFSRGMKISYNNTSQFYVSGTASINSKGETIYHNDSQGQIVETLLNIASLLNSEKASLKNIARAAAYCKNKEVYEKAKQIIKSFDLESIPFIYVFADVCRDDLMFEVGAIAVK